MNMPRSVPRSAVACAVIAAAALLPAARASGAVPPGLYQATVTGDASEAGRAAAASDALRQVVVRVTGRRAAASDGALDGLYADARRYALSFRSDAAGQLMIGFDPDALDAALARAGQPLWPRDRPATLVLLASERTGVPRTLAGDPEARREIERAAQARGLPLVWPAALAAATEQPLLAAVAAGRLEPLRALAQSLGADGVLVRRSAAPSPGWSWLGPAGAGAATGTAAEAVDALADRYAAQYAVREAGAGRVGVVVRGVRDLTDYAGVLAALAALATVRGVEVFEVEGETLHLRVGFRGEPEGLRDAVLQSGRFDADEPPLAAGELRFVLRR
jgi:hypothetical protein